MQTAAEMMILPVESRRQHFRSLYAIELGRLHASGACIWPVERLPEMVGRAMSELMARKMPSGPAIDATRKAFALTTHKATFDFLGA